MYMDLIESTIVSLLKANPEWIKCITAFPQSTSHLTKDEFIFYKKQSTLKECKSEKTYKIIKKLLMSQGIRSVHPVWFFIHRENFENDNFIFEENIIDDFDTLDITIPDDVHIPNRIQIIATLKIYYSLLSHEKIDKCFIENNSPFTKKYTEFKDISQYLYFPEIEVKSNSKFIDLTYNFNGIIENINIEINEPHHNVSVDNSRANYIFFNSFNRIIQYYVNKDVKTKDINESINKDLSNVLEEIFFKLTKGIFKKDVYAGLTFNAFIRNIIPNLFIAIFFSKLKKECNEQKLTWKIFRNYCKEVEINIDINFIKIINNELPDEQDEKIIELNKRFYNYTEFSNDTLLTETGCDYYLMLLNKKQSKDSLLIKGMYSLYKQEYEKIMTQIMTDSTKEQDMLRTYFKPIYDKFKECIKILK